jgi:DNA-binding beta-propeller fold protein YncE
MIRIYFTYEPTHVTDTTRALVRFAPDGTGGELLGDNNVLAWGVPHGLRLSEEPDGDFLYHANNGHVVHKTDLEGLVVWSNNVTSAWTGTRFWPCLPTDAVVPPGSNIVYVADGYGSSFVHLLDARSGEYKVSRTDVAMLFPDFG